jgi:NAD(P)-dependent dehydrogenase (short-subunit alcohol dehydrogenase family)
MAIQLKPINQQVVAVVGASSGIGRETALLFAKQGAKVTVSARNQEGLNSLVEEIQSFGGEAIAVSGDVADFNQVKAIADKTVDHFGRLDTWVHAAATGMFARFQDITPEEFKRVIDVSLMGQVYGAMVALPHLKREGRGAMIHVSSVEAHVSLPLQSPYSCSKHGTEGFLDSLRVELMHDNIPISVTNIMPSVINTPFYNKSKTKLGVKPMAVPPFYQPELVAKAIVYTAEHPTRDMIVGDTGRILDLVHKFSPHLSDAILNLVAVKGQHTTTTKYESDPNNLYEPIDGYNKSHGDYDQLAVPSFLEALDFNPIAKWGTIASVGALALFALLGTRD